MPSSVITLIIVAGSMFALFIIISTVGNYYSLNRIKNKTVGQGQHGTARCLTQRLVRQPLDDHAQHRADNHGNQNAKQGGHAPVLRGTEGNVRANHDDVAVREVQHLGNAVDHRVAQGDDGIHAAKADAVDEVREELKHPACTSE